MRLDLPICIHVGGEDFTRSAAAGGKLGLSVNPAIGCFAALAIADNGVIPCFALGCYRSNGLVGSVCHIRSAAKDRYSR